MKITGIIGLLFLSFTGMAQHHFELHSTTPEKFKENVTVHSICSDQHESSYLIWVKDSVKPHYHAKHTECVYIMQGAGVFYLGDKKFNVKPGDFLRIPQGAVHSFKTTGKETVKVLSVQTPEFKGKDRIWVEQQQ